MPHLRIRGLDDSVIQKLSQSLPQELAKTLNTSEDNFTIEKISTTFFRSGQPLKDSEADPMIEFLWFDRGADARQRAAQIVTAQVKAYSSSEAIAVVFTTLPKDHYFENGKHF